ncbi:hypothetical protein TNCV_1914391 [Trichonephila clavipes]|nr:hypothetical protein TNCV_1914391 [Trichonephila clavipes]
MAWDSIKLLPSPPPTICNEVHLLDTATFAKVLEPAVAPYLQGLSAPEFQQDKAQSLVAGTVLLFFINHRGEVTVCQAYTPHLIHVVSHC